MSYLVPEERDLFFKLNFDLLYCVNKTHNIVGEFCDGRYPKSVDPEKAYRIKDELFKNPEWIGEYVQQHGDEMTDEERKILLSWQKHYIHDCFLVVRYLKKYSVLMRGDNNDAQLFGVIGLNHPFADLFDPSSLPVMINATLLPFTNKIVYDGLLSAYPIRIGSHMRKNINEQYSATKAKSGIIERLPFDNVASQLGTTKVQKSGSNTSRQTISHQVVDIMQIKIAEIMKGFFRENLNDEFLDVCLYALKKLSRKRPSPLYCGNAWTWAGGIVYAVASNNFVFDRSQSYYMSAQDIADGFGLSKSTLQSHASRIKKMLNIDYFKPEYVIASLRDSENSPISMLLSFKNIFNFIPEK